MINCDKCPAKLNPNLPCCCGIIPFPLKFLESHKPFFKADGELKDDGNRAVILTKDFRCVFFDRKTFLCSIYDERPEVCRLYGTIKELPCAYFKRSGNRRSPASEKITTRQINTQIDKFIKKYGK